MRRPTDRLYGATISETREAGPHNAVRPSREMSLSYPQALLHFTRAPISAPQDMPRAPLVAPRGSWRGAARVCRAPSARAHQRCAVDAPVAGELRRRIAGGGQPDERFLEVALLERTVARRPLRERTGQAVGGGLILVRARRLVAELHGDGVSHLVRDDADGRHVAVGAELSAASFAWRATNTSSK